MAQLFDIQKVTVGPKNLEAVVALAPSAPVMTSDDIEATAHVFDLLPGLVDHICLGDSSERFTEVAGDTELAHLLEHVTVELLAQTDIAGDISSGRTTQVGDRLYQITLACPDDVLVAGALSSAVWILQWAFSGAGDPRPDVAATVEGLVALVESLGEKDEQPQEPAASAEKDEEPATPSVEEQPVAAPAPAPAEPEPYPSPEPLPLEEEPVETEEPLVPEGAGETGILEPIAEPAPVLIAPEPVQAELQPEFAPVPAEPVPAPDPEPQPEAEEPEPQPEAETEPEPAKPADPWDSIDAPRPHLVR